MPMEEINKGMATPESQKKKKTKFPMSRLKKIMQSNEDIGKISSSVPVVASRAIELFLEELVSLTHAEAKKRGSNRLLYEFVRSVISNNPKFGFLKTTDDTSDLS